MQKTTIYIYGDNSTGTTFNNNNVLGQINVADELSITYQINDVKNVGSINSDYTRSFKVKGNNEVNILFGEIFQITTNNRVFNQNKKVRAEVKEGDDVILNGYLQLKSIDVIKDDITYEVIIYGSNDNLIKNIGDAYLKDLDFEDSRHVYSATSMVDSWKPDNQVPYYYPLLDNGNDWDYDDLNGVRNSLREKDLKPATNLYYLLNKIFAYAGKTFTSGLFNTRRFRNLIIPFYGEQLKFDSEVVDNMKARVGFTTTFIGTTQAGTTWQYRLPLDLDNIFPFYDNGNNFDVLNNYYINNSQYNVRLNILFQGRIKTYNNGGSNLGFVYLVFKNDSTGANIASIPISTNLGQDYFYAYRLMVSTTLNIGDKIGIYLNIYDPDNPGAGLPAFEFYDSFIQNGTTNYSFFDFNVEPFILLGNSITLRDALPKNVKAFDVLKSVATAFNLVVEPDPDNYNNYIVESRNDYYRSGITIDWSSKFVASKPVESQLISDYVNNKQLIFTYKKDSDFYNSDYTTRAEDEIYGQKIIDIDNDFVKQDSKKKIELIFAPSPLTKIIGNDEIVLTKLGKQNDQFQWKAADSVIRLLNKAQDGYINLTGSTIKFEGSGFTHYPYAGHVNRPANETFDLNWDVCRFYYYSKSANTMTLNNIYNLYWSNYIDEITSPDARIYTAYFNLNSQDIKSFRFWNRIYFEMNGQGQEFYVNKIIDYKPGKNIPTKVELVKVLNLPESTKTIKPKEGERLSNPGNFGDNSVEGKAFGVIGYNNRVMNGSQEGLIVGSNNNVLLNSRFNMISGSGNTVSSFSERNIIFNGLNNSLPPGSTGNTLITTSGSSFTFGVSGSTIIGLNNFTGQSSNTVYVAALNVNSGLTINGININQYWTASTGSNSLVRYPELGSVMGSTKGIITAGQNNTGGTAGSYQFISQGFKNKTNYAFSTVLNGLYNSAISTKALVGSGFQNLASGFYSTIINGRGNSGATAYATIINGRDNYISGNTDTFGLIIQGRSNKIQRGYFSSIFNGDNNLIKDSTFSNIVAGNDMIISGYSVQSSIINGDENRIYGLGYHSLIGNGVLNIIKNNSGVIHNYNTIINGFINTIIANKYSTIINGRYNLINNCNNSTIVNGINNNINNSTGITLLSISNYTANSLSNTVIADRLILRSLTGTGYQYVVADANGQLSLSAITSSGSGSTVNNYYNNGYWETGTTATGIKLTGWSSSVSTIYSIHAGYQGSLSNGNYAGIFAGSGNTNFANFGTIIGGQYNDIDGISFGSILNSRYSRGYGKGDYQQIINSNTCVISGDVSFSSIINSQNSSIYIVSSTTQPNVILIGQSGYTHRDQSDVVVLPNLYTRKGRRTTYTNIDSTYTATTNDYYIRPKASGTYTIYLPKNPYDGMELIIKDYNGSSSSNIITINGNGFLIDGSTTIDLDNNYKCYKLIFCSKDNKWDIISVYN